MKESVLLPQETMPENVGSVSEEEGYAHILRGLISYHERMTMGMYPERDCYTKALRYALGLVERENDRELAKEVDRYERRKK